MAVSTDQSEGKTTDFHQEHIHNIDDVEEAATVTKKTSSKDIRSSSALTANEKKMELRNDQNLSERRGSINFLNIQESSHFLNKDIVHEMTNKTSLPKIKLVIASIGIVVGLICFFLNIITLLMTIKMYENIARRPI